MDENGGATDLMARRSERDPRASLSPRRPRRGPGVPVGATGQEGGGRVGTGGPITAPPPAGGEVSPPQRPWQGQLPPRAAGSGGQSQPKWGWVSAECPSHVCTRAAGASECPWKLHKGQRRARRVRLPFSAPPEATCIGPFILSINLCHFLQE